MTPSFQIHRTERGWSRSSALDEDEARAHELVGVYIKHFHPLHPFIKRLEIERLLKELSILPTRPPIDEALVSLMMALGELHESPSPGWLYHDPTPPSSDGKLCPGQKYFDHATVSLQGDTIQHVQGNLLAALYLAQIRKLPNSYSYLRIASQVRVFADFGGG